MPTLTPLTRPLRRLIRTPATALVVTVTEAGLELRGYRRRSSRLVTWEQIASLADDQPLFQAAELAAGRRALHRLAPNLTKTPEPASTES